MTRRFDLQVGTLPAETLAIARFTGTEAISQPFRFHITVVSALDAPTARQKLLGAGARLTIRGADARERRVQGHIDRIQVDGMDGAGGTWFYTVRLAPRLRLLGRRVGCRIFQDKAVPEIVAALLDEHGVHHRRRLNRDYPPRPYCVQYQESDLAFASRILAEEGIFHYFSDPEPGAPIDDGEIVVLGDTVDSYDAGEPPELQHREADGGRETGSWIHDFRAADKLATLRVDVGHFDFTRPRLRLRAPAFAADPKPHTMRAPLEVYDYRYDLEEHELRSDAGDIHLEQRRRRQRRAGAESGCVALRPGGRFRMSEHPSHDLNALFAVARLAHEGHQPEVARAMRVMDKGSEPSYRNRLSCIPGDIAVRPRRPRRVLQQVTETATVVGPPGEDIHTDKYGRIKVQFHWDREGRHDERSSCWIRTMQSWSGPGWGSQFIPRIGMEVVVAFSGGDTDRPIVLGCLYNGIDPPPFELPEHKTQSGIRTRSTPGGNGANELMFDDAAGAERVFLHAQRDFDASVERDHSRAVGRDETASIRGNKETTIGADNARTVRGNEVVTVEKDFVLHVLGRQWIQIDGSGGSDSQRSAPKRHRERAAASPPLDFDALVPRPDRAATDAELLWRVAKLPAEVQEAGEDWERRITDAVSSLDGLRRECAAIRAQVELLAHRIAEGTGRYIDLGAVHALSARAERMRERSARAILICTHAYVDARTPGDGRLAPVRELAANTARGVIAEIEGLCGAVIPTIDRLRGAHGLPSTRETPEAIAGEAFGGGGAPPPKWDQLSKDYPLEFLAPENTAGVREIKPAPGDGGSSMMIRGGGQIVSPEGFRVGADSCTVELSNGIVTLSGKTVEIDAETVKINGATIEIKGGKVNVTGQPIKLN